MASIKPQYSKKFTKGERLSRKKWINELFQEGKSIKSNPLKAIFLINEELEIPQVLITIPKRNFKKSSARNLLKRRIREAYRINKHILDLPGGKNPMIAYIYLDDESLPFVEIEKAVKDTLSKMNKIIQRDESV